jgi:hypothetical protein
LWLCAKYHDGRMTALPVVCVQEIRADVERDLTPLADETGGAPRAYGAHGRGTAAGRFSPPEDNINFEVDQFGSENRKPIDLSIGHLRELRLWALEGKPGRVEFRLVLQASYSFGLSRLLSAPAPPRTSRHHLPLSEGT